MNTEKIEKYKNKLKQERKMLLAEIRESEKPSTFGTDIDSGDEETDEAEELSNQLAIAHDLKNRLSEIDIALGKIQSGGYGICESCGKHIEDEILEISPESRFCKECKLKK
jgi:DnaK suppressor protein